jgi:hypothetical protein
MFKNKYNQGFISEVHKLRPAKLKWHAKKKNNLECGDVQIELSLCLNWAPPHEGVFGDWRYSATHSWPLQ